MRSNIKEAHSAQLLASIFLGIVRQRMLTYLGFQIDDYAKDGGPGEVWLLCSFHNDPLRAYTIKNIDNFAIWVRMSEYYLHNSPDSKDRKGSW